MSKRRQRVQSAYDEGVKTRERDDLDVAHGVASMGLPNFKFPFKSAFVAGYKGGRAEERRQLLGSGEPIRVV